MQNDNKMKNKILLFTLFCTFFGIAQYLTAQGDITVDISPVCAGTDDGSISLTFNTELEEGENPCADYLFSWFYDENADGDYTEEELLTDYSEPCTLTDLAAGSYYLVVDDGGCTAEGEFTVESIESIQITNTQLNATCSQEAEGSVQVAVNPTNPPYTFTWTDGFNNPVSSTETGGNSTLVENLLIGEYTLLITDADGCTYSETFDVTQTEPIPLTYIERVKISTGSGVDIYAAEWITSESGNCILYDGGSIPINLNELTDELITVQVETNNPLEYLQLEAFGQGDTAPPSNSEGTEFTFTFSGGTLNNQAASGLVDETLYFRSIDAEGYQLLDLFLMSEYYGDCIEPGMILTDCSSTPPYIKTGTDRVHRLYLSCFGEAPEFLVNYENFIIKITNIGGEGYTYEWTGPTINNQNVNTEGGQQNISNGEYCVTIEDAEGCITTGCVTVYWFQVNVDVEEICPGDTEADICAVVEYGSGDYEYTWFIDGVEYNTSCVTGVAIGSSVELSVVDLISGFQTETPISIDVDSPAAMALSAEIEGGCEGENDSKICLDISGGTEPYIYQWSGFSAQSSSCKANLPTGQESCVTVTDACGSTITECFTPEYEPLSIDDIIVTNPSEDCYNGVIEVLASGNPQIT